jgi:excinuclease ABC subunit B
LDNRPLQFDEWRARTNQVIYVSATPAEYEMHQSQSNLVEQIVRPTGLVDPTVIIRRANHQVDDLYTEIKDCIERQERVLVTTLTKRMAEDLTEYYSELGVAVKYLHSDISTLERMDIIRDLRIGNFDVLIGINLLREGLDIPEVSLVAILDADKEGFLRSTRSMIQTFGRAARNINGKVILYADVTTRSMARAIEETDRRRFIQMDYNQTHNIIPETIQKNIPEHFGAEYQTLPIDNDGVAEPGEGYASIEKIETDIVELERRMHSAAKELDFELAAELRDRIKLLRKKVIFS